MIGFDAGDIVLVRFPFTDLAASKQRPALVVHPAGYPGRYGDAVVLALTSRPQPDDSLAIRHWLRAGLPQQTWIKPLIATLSTPMFTRTIGRIAPEDLVRAEAAIRLLIDSRFIPRP
jgi:mRNA interferase MazF